MAKELPLELSDDGRTLLGCRDGRLHEPGMPAGIPPGPDELYG